MTARKKKKKATAAKVDLFEVSPKDAAAARHQEMTEQVMVNLQAKLKEGKILTAAQMKTLDAYLEGHGPGEMDQAARRAQERKDEDPGGPDDVVFHTLAQATDLLGIHANTMTNWRKTGITPVGEKPWSLKAFCLLLRRSNKLSKCQPVSKAHDIWAWAFGPGAGGAVNPDDPAHAPPMDWDGEKDRQGALAALTTRRNQQVELETKLRERIPAEEVAQRLTQLRNHVTGVLGGVLIVANRVKDLTPDQRATLSDELQKWKGEAAAKLAELARKTTTERVVE